MATASVSIRLLAFDIDGTLTDATTWWGGEPRGWLQRYSVRDGEALLRMKAAGLHVLPLSRNRTASAAERMGGLGLDARWLGVRDKGASLRQIQGEYQVDAAAIAFVGDGPDDAEVFGKVGLGMAVADAHPEALAAAHVVLAARGGERVIEEVELRLSDRWPPVVKGARA
ncbi:HAD hydrolase family protein [Paraliomyxa miuraensis]|uniref:HAD hydrolase family protein n=1 Tax=Paraliomyxa miuraensis TaxID=376150 RepID=UPI00225AAC3E|nr:HAD hydrolase family protein [Paraliomyxa miuraensis]MCX4240687.1 HAD hydrolase family protein [Paraliomyxa miuraensis]